MNQFGEYFVRHQFIVKTKKLGPDLDAKRKRLTIKSGVAWKLHPIMLNGLQTVASCTLCFQSLEHPPRKRAHYLSVSNCQTPVLYFAYDSDLPKLANEARQ
jgi:hypothetical protein